MDNGYWRENWNRYAEFFGGWCSLSASACGKAILPDLCTN